MVTMLMDEKESFMGCVWAVDGDRGVADGSQETIKAAMAGVPGQLLSQEFVDFSTTRNWALRVRP